MNDGRRIMGRRKIIDEPTLLQHARALFLKQGLATTTKAIAARAGVSEGVIFARFPSKTALFTAAMMPPEIEVDSLVANDIADPNAALVETGHRLLAHFRKIIPLALRLMENASIDMTALGEEFGADRVDMIARKLADFLQQKDDDKTLRVTNPLASAHLLIAAIHSVALYELMGFHGSNNLDHSIKLFVDALCAGLPPGERALDGP